MGRALAIGLASAVLAFTAGILVGMSLGERAPADHSPLAHESSTASPDAHAGSRKRPDAERVHTRNADETVIPASLGALDPAVPLTGDGIITGHVLRNDDDAPIGGVRILAHARAPKEWKSPGWLAPFEERIADAARRYRWHEASRHETRTDANGAFTISGLANRAYFLNARIDGYRVRRVSDSPRDILPGAEVDFHAWPETEVTFRLSGPDGTTPASASIDIASGNQTSGRSWSAEQPTVTLTPTSGTMVVTAGEFRQLRSDSMRLEIAPGDPARTVDVTLRSVPGIGGVLSHEGPDSNQPLTVRLLRVPAGSAPSEQELLNVYDSRTVRPGEPYAFDDLAAGDYAIGVGRHASEIALIEVVHVDDGFVRVDLCVPDYVRDECLELMVRAPDGTPLRLVGVVLEWETPTTMSAIGTDVSIRANGTLWVPLAPTHDPSTGTHRVRIRTEKYGSLVREFTPAPGARLEVTLPEPAHVTVVVGGYSGHAVEGRVAIAVRRPPHPHPEFHQKVDATGRLVLPPLAPGEHVLQLRIDSEFRNGRLLAEQRITVAAGASEVVLPIPALHRLTVELTGEVGERRVSVTREGEHSFDWRTPDSSGFVTFENLPAGEYTVEISNGSGGRKRVSIPETRHVTF